MEIVLAALVAAAVSVAVVLVVQRPRAAQASAAPVGRTPEPRAPEPTEARPAPAALESTDDVDEELRARRAELAPLEERLRAEEQSLELQGQELPERQRAFDDRRRNPHKDIGQPQDAKAGAGPGAERPSS